MINIPSYPRPPPRLRRWWAFLNIFWVTRTRCMSARLTGVL